MGENEEDRYGMDKADAYLLENPNAIEINFSAAAASKFICFYLENCVPDDERAKERMKFDALFKKINTTSGEEAGVLIYRTTYDVVSDALLRLKAERNQEQLPF